MRSRRVRRSTRGLGPIGSTAEGTLGLVWHSTLALTPDGSPLGVLEAQCWARDEKESRKWLESVRVARALCAEWEQTQIVAVSDCESDGYELFALARSQPDGPAVLVRARDERAVATLEVRYTAVTLRPPAGQAGTRVRADGAGGGRVDWSAGRAFGSDDDGEFCRGGAVRSDYGLRAQIEERHRMIKCFYDLTDFRSRSLALVTSQVVLVLLTYTPRKLSGLWKWHPERLAGRGPEWMREELNVGRESVVIYHEQSYAQLPLVSVSRELVQLEGVGRGKALGKITEMEQAMFEPPSHPRPR